MKKLLPLIVAILITNILSAQLPLTGIQAWYPFCNNPLDHGPNGFDLGTVGPATAPVIDNDRFGNPNTAYLFNGGSSGLSYAAPFLTGFAFTYSCWIKPTIAQSSIIWFNGNPGTDGFGIYMNNGTLGLPGSNIEVVFGGGLGQFSSTAITLNVWHHIVLTKNGGAFHFYIDGTDVPFVGLPTFAVPTGQFTVGQNYVSNGDVFTGDIDDIAVYNVLLLTSQIAQLNTFDPDVAPFTFGNASSDTVICTNTLTLTPSPAFDTANYSYLWSTIGAPTTTSITVTPPGPPGAFYTLSISTKPAQYGCPNSYTIHVSHLTVGINIGPRAITFCTVGSATLNPTPAAGETYLWSTGDTTGSIAITTAGTYWVVVDSAGCTGADTTTVAVQPPVIVRLGSDTSSCTGAPIAIQSSVVHGPGSTYAWGGSPLPAGITTGPTYTVTVSGTYWLTVDSGACNGSDTQKVGIVYDTLSILGPLDTAICKNGAVQVRGHGNPAATNFWTPTAGISSALSVNPLITPDTSAWYKITASLLGCTTTDSIHIDVQPNPTVYIGGNRSVCRYDSIHIHAFVSPEWYTGYIYSWTPPGYLDNTTTGTVVFTAGDSTSLILTVTTQNHKCIGVDSAEIMVHTPHFTFLRDTTICPGDSVLLDPSPLAGDSYAWHPGIYLSDSNAVQPLAKPITTQAYWIYSTDQFGCHDTMTQNIRVLPGAVIDLGDSVILYPGETYQISPQTNCVAFSWRPPLGLSDTAISNPIASPVVSTKFIVRATTEWGCFITDSINVHVDPSTIVALPNAFTPGSNINNRLFVLKRGIAVLNYIRIFNKWGNIVYESTNIDAGWDGTFNGKPQPFGVYVYDLQAVTDKGVIFDKTGNVTLIR